MILVTGATGRLGRHVVGALRRINQPVRALVRKGSHYYWLNETGCDYFFGDLRDPVSLQRATAGVRYVIACSGIEVETRANNHTSCTVEGHAQLWAAASARDVEHVVYISALGVDRGYPVPWFDAKQKVEQGLAASSLSWTVLRPGPFSRVYAELARKATRRGVAWFPGPADNLVAPIWPGDVARYAIAALEAQSLRGRAIELVGLDEMTTRQAVQQASAASPGEGRVRYLPGPLVRGGARGLRPVLRRWEHRAKHLALWSSDDFVAPMGDLMRDTGIRPVGFDEAIANDYAEILPLEDPDARLTQVVHRRFDATVYQPGEVDFASLPSGPRRYLD